MLIKEEDADHYWCPHVRLDRGGYPATYNRTAWDMPLTPEKKAHCIGDSCMMWRWNSRRDGDDLGYCGLAGKPVDEG